MKFLRKILLVGLLPGFLISQAQNVQNKEDVPLDLGYRVLPMGDLTVQPTQSRVNSYAIHHLALVGQNNQVPVRPILPKDL